MSGISFRQKGIPQFRSVRDVSSESKAPDILTILFFSSLVFTSWRLTLDVLASMLDTRGIGYVKIDGRVDAAERHLDLDRFEQESAIKVLLMSLEIGSVG